MTLIKNILKNLKDIIPYTFKIFYKKKFRKFYGLKNTDEKMLKYINYNNGYFIEIGAHDGIHNSNTFYFEKNLNWNGILVEPSNYYKLLIKNRSKKNNFFNNGCSKFNNDDVEVILTGSGDFSYCEEIIDKEYSEWYSKKLLQTSKKITKKKIKLKTLNSILIESQAPKLIDFFSLDVEGMEMEVLEGVDYNSFNFKYLLVECNNKSKYEKVKNFLIEKKYKHINNLTPWDCLFQFKN